MSSQRGEPGTYAVRPARADDIPLLPAIDLAAAARFRTSPFPFVADGATEIEVFQNGQARQQLWLAVDAEDRPVGFALACVVDDALYLDELAVDPAHGRCGLGTQLLETVCHAAQRTGYRAVTLSTFREIAWNAPFYQRRGFRLLAEAEVGPGLQAVRAEEGDNGLPVAERVFMRRDV